MKKVLIIIMLATGFMLPAKPVHAQIAILEIIKAGVKKVIKAVDLKIQRQQNKVIWLQNAQKVLENAMSKLKLEEISDWTEKQRTLYKDYFDELNKVRSIIAYYRKVKDITEKQVMLVEAYKRAWNLLRQDKHFTLDELNYMQQVYSGILDESVKNLEQLYMVVNSFQTQMSDSQRLKLIDDASEKVDGNYTDLQAFNRGNIQLSIQRAKSQQEIEGVKKLYGLQ
jgi:asparagine N-glycosylation enzyme membrane subunit Stt3